MHSHRSSLGGEEDDPLFEGGDDEDNKRPSNQSESHNSFNSSRSMDMKDKAEGFKIKIQDFTSSIVTSKRNINKSKSFNLINQNSIK